MEKRPIGYKSKLLKTTLIKVDINKRINRYCILDVVGDEMESCFRIVSGRIGTVKTKVEHYTNIVKAITRFKTEYNLRTGNVWGEKRSNPNRFVHFYSCNRSCPLEIAPLGLPTKSRIQRAHKTLDRIKVCMKEKRAIIRSKGLDPEEYIENKLTDLSNEYFKLIPHKEPYVIRSLEQYYLCKYRLAQLDRY